MSRARTIALCASCALSACAGSGEGLDENGRPLDEQAGAVLEPTFLSIQQHVFIPHCAACHSGAAAPLGLRLDDAGAYAALVNAPSVEQPAVLRVRPGEPDASYLVHKLEGVAAVGARMPLDAPPLPASTILVIRQWIIDGAPAASGAETLLTAAPAQLKATSPAAGGSLTSPPQEIILSSDAELLTSLLQADLASLRASGADGSFAEGNERDIPLRLQVRLASPTILAFHVDGPPLAPDSYELRVSGGPPLALTDTAGREIDGDLDGAPGGDFVLRFTVEPSP